MKEIEENFNLDTGVLLQGLSGKKITVDSDFHSKISMFIPLFSSKLTATLHITSKRLTLT